MKRRHSLLVLLLLCVPVSAQQDTSPDGPPQGERVTSPLTPRQQRVNRMMRDLERMFLSLAQTLEKTEPERAERLVKAFQQSKELLIEQRMEEIVRLLELAGLDRASGEQEKIIEDLSQLIRLLLDDGVDPEKLEEEIERLKRWRELIEQLLKEEQKHLRESDKVAHKDKTLADLERLIKAVQELIRRQDELIRKTAGTPDQDPQQLDELAGDQGGIRKDTQSLAEEVAAAGGQSDSSQTGDQAGSQPGAQTGAQAGSQAGSQPGARAGDQAGGQAKPSGASRAGSPSSEPGEQPLREAAAHQQSAEQQLQDAKRQAAQDEEEKSLDELKKALAELQQEQDRLQAPPAQIFPKLADEQDVTAGKTAKLNDEMAKASQSGSPSDGGQPGGAPCGQQQTANACQCMQQASGQLQNQQAGAASQKQGEAVEELKKALEELEKRLAELGEQMQDEVLVQLEDIFREMLERQREVSADTIELDEKEREADGTLRRADRLALKQLAQEERELATMAQDAHDLLIEDGTSIVFPSVVADLRDNLQTVAGLLDDQRTNDYTQTLQREIETTLEELIDALQKTAGGGGGGGGGSCAGRPPLVTSTAELKLLRALQLRVNRRTKAFDKTRPENLDETMKTEIARIAELQAEISHMVERILERIQ